VNDERVDVNAENDFLCTPLMMCAQSERVDELEYMLANRLVTHIDQAIFYSHPGGKCHEILTLYKDNPAKVKAVLRFKLGLSHKDAASLFLDVVMLCDGYFEFTDIEMNNTTFRFFLMVKKLPMELQMTLCNVCYYINKPFISMLLINNALKKIK
jgi:predicted RNA-binding protein associated with RNAse of E/G family